MKIDGKIRASRWAMLLLLASGAAMAHAAEVETEAARPDAATGLADVVSERADACVGADCTAPTVMPASDAFEVDVMPKLSLPALLGTEQAEDRC